jgi:creatinine amidohydrolase
MSLKLLIMKRVFFLIMLFILPCALVSQISPAWEELTSGEFAKAVEFSQGVCVIPIGVIEKHGQHLPLGTDVYTSRELSLRAADREYAIVFPFYFAGQINEAKHQPGTVAYSPQMIYNLLEETCREISRNGIKKILIVNGHGGNNSFLQYFCQSQLYKERDYVVYLFSPEVDQATQEKIKLLRKSNTGGHADEVETSNMMYVRRDLVKVDRAAKETGADLNRLNLKNAYTGIWWYAKYPNHYAGDASGASEELGEVAFNQKADQLAGVIKQVKEDKIAPELQKEFFRKSGEPLKTKPVK